jgi:hypothetical protein
MDERESNPAWVPGEVRPPEGPHIIATALRMMDHSITVWREDPDEGAKLSNSASVLFGSGVLLALQDMQASGTLPPPGTAAWDAFAAQAEAGDVEIAVVVLVRDREPLCEDKVARRFGQANPPAPAKPVKLADELRAMGLM